MRWLGRGRMPANFQGISMVWTHQDDRSDGRSCLLRTLSSVIRWEASHASGPGRVAWRFCMIRKAGTGFPKRSRFN
jgi:hypothetical protein